MIRGGLLLHFVIHCRKAEAEICIGIRKGGIRIDCYVPSMQSGNAPGDAQSQPGPVSLVGDKWIEQCFKVFIRDTGAIVFYVNAEHFIFTGGSKSDTGVDNDAAAMFR